MKTGWTPWQLRLYHGLIAVSLLAWVVWGSTGGVAGRLGVAVLAAGLPASRAWIRIVFGAAILALLASRVPGRELPPDPVLAAVVFCVLTPAAWPLPAILAAAAILNAIGSTRAAFWIPVALPAILPPRWIPGLASAVPATVFYDGHCGLCHHTVRFLLAEDPAGVHFRFSPLHSRTFETTIPPAIRATLPDSVVVWAPDRAVALVRSSAALYLLRRLGGYWRILGEAGRIIPSNWLDGVYDAIARVRRRIFAAPADACPLMPRDLRSRFDLD